VRERLDVRRHLGEALLGAVVQLALQSPTLRVRRLDDPPARGGELLHPTLHLGLELNVAHRHPRRRSNGLDQRGILERRAVMHQHGDPAVVAVDRRDRTALTRVRRGERPARFVDVAALGPPATNRVRVSGRQARGRAGRAG
jgi:hypothetical protein